MKIEIKFKVDISNDEIEKIRELIEDNLGFEIIEINEVKIEWILNK